MNLKQVLYILYGLGAAGFVLIMAGGLLKSALAIALGCLIMIAGIVLNIVKWRCPHCGDHLGSRGGKYCPHCGRHLVDLE